NPGFFPMHDDTQVARVFEMHKSLSDGMFPVRWVADLGYGYGYPIFNFYAPLAYYIGALFIFLGFNALVATKIMIGLGIILAGVFMYIFAREFWGKTGGVISAALYVYAPYHALNTYVRGAVTELWAYALIPLTFFSIYKLFFDLRVYASLEQKSKIKNQKSKIKQDIWFWVCLTAISYAAIIISHNLTAMMVTPFIFLFATFLYIKLRTADTIHKPYFIFLGLLIGIFLSAFYWLPVLFEMKFTDVLSVVGGGSDYKDHFACHTQLWSSPWGFAGSGPGCVDGFSLMIGKLHIVLGIISLIVFPFLFKKDKNKFYICLIFLILLLLSIFLTLKESRFIWDALPHMAFFQFPWRFLVTVSFFISFFGGAIFWLLVNIGLPKYILGPANWITCTVVIAAIIIINADVFTPQKFISVKTADYTSKDTLNWKISKISDEYMPKGFFKPLRSIDVPKRKFELTDKNLKISSIDEKTQQIRATVIAPEKTTIYVNVAYFPGWHVFVDNKQVWFKYSGQGLLIDIPKGRHTLDIKFTQTPIEMTGNSISIAGVIVLLAGIISHRNKIYDQKSS
ncbi:MAG TPA: hypothetical protein VNA13_05420, partial [Xanthomonadales bacterium]|nr:hypothetical protein [Xanthomonadales bacterium]